MGQCTSAITSNARVFTWGQNYFGELGDGTTTNRYTPTEITNQFNLNIGEAVISLSLGSNHSSALTSDGRVFTWGRNYFGELGIGTTSGNDSNPVPIDITGNFTLGFGETIISLLLGYNHSSALTSNGRVFTWGYNGIGQLGDGTAINKYTPTEITSQYNLSVEETVISLSIGGYHSSAFTSNGRVLTWGWNRDGQLGDGETTDKSTPAIIPFIYSTLIKTDTYSYNQVINEHIPILEGYTFDGWYTDIELTIPYIFTTMPSNNIVLYGKWIAN